MFFSELFKRQSVTMPPKYQYLRDSCQPDTRPGTHLRSQLTAAMALMLAHKSLAELQLLRAVGKT